MNMNPWDPRDRLAKGHSPLGRGPLLPPSRFANPLSRKELEGIEPEAGSGQGSGMGPKCERLMIGWWMAQDRL